MRDIVQSIVTLVYYYNSNINVPEGFIGSLNPKAIFLGPVRVKQMFQSDPSCQQYMSEIDSRSWSLKTHSNGSKESYLSRISNFKSKERTRLRICIRKLPESSLLTGDWVFAKTSERLELGMPYTLSNVVFLPPSIIKDTPTFRKTLCHERIHILQRQYQSLFDTFIQKNMGFSKSVINGKLPVIPFANPDGPQTPGNAWIFQHQKKWYYPLLTMSLEGELKREGIEIQPVQFNFRGDVSLAVFTHKKTPLSHLLASRFPSCPRHHLYHPYEILAELGAIFLTTGKSGDMGIDDFFRELQEIRNR
jgi:hypothetical protein